MGNFINTSNKNLLCKDSLKPCIFLVMKEGNFSIFSRKTSSIYVKSCTFLNHLRMAHVKILRSILT